MNLTFPRNTLPAAWYPNHELQIVQLRIQDIESNAFETIAFRNIVMLTIKMPLLFLRRGLLNGLYKLYILRFSNVQFTTIETSAFLAPKVKFSWFSLRENHQSLKMIKELFNKLCKTVSAISISLNTGMYHIPNDLFANFSRL